MLTNVMIKKQVVLKYLNSVVRNNEWKLHANVCTLYTNVLELHANVQSMFSKVQTEMESLKST